MENIITDYDLLDWSKDWTLGITYTDKHNSEFLTIFQNGANSIMFRLNHNPDNQSIYVTSGINPERWGVNTWCIFEDGDKFLFIYDSYKAELKIIRNGVNKYYISIGKNERVFRSTFDTKIAINRIIEQNEIDAYFELYNKGVKE